MLRSLSGTWCWHRTADSNHLSSDTSALYACASFSVDTIIFLNPLYGTGNILPVLFLAPLEDPPRLPFASKPHRDSKHIGLAQTLAVFGSSSSSIGSLMVM